MAVWVNFGSRTPQNVSALAKNCIGGMKLYRRHGREDGDQVNHVNMTLLGTERLRTGLY